MEKNSSFAKRMNSVVFGSIDVGCLPQGKRAYLVMDLAIEHLFGKKLSFLLQIPYIALGPSESAKTRKQKERLEDALLKEKIGRDGILIALGGGAILDLVGFTASTYLRGIPWIAVPTTLLAMVDASIGGKTAINVPQGKNLLGAFHPPIQIFCDLEYLKTLPQKEWFNGQAEMLKIAAIYDRDLFFQLQQEKIDAKHIAQAIQLKEEIVVQDPYEEGIRRILNFGHTIAHALEGATNYEMSHGIAVAFGCRIESWISHQMGILPLEDLKRIDEAFSWAIWDAKPPCHSLIFECLQHDKKGKGGVFRMVMIERLGRALEYDGEYCTFVSSSLIEEALDVFF